MQSAIVPKQSEPCMTAASDRDRQLRRLAEVEPTDADFLSCYLNLAEGRQACERFINDRSKALRAAQEGALRLDFGQAFDLVESALDGLYAEPSTLPPAVAIFTRGLNAACHLTVVPFDRPVDPVMTFYRVPDLTQLWIDRPSDQGYTLLLARRGGIQVLDVHGAGETSRAWASYRIDQRSPKRGNVEIPQQRTKLLGRSLAGQGDRPIVVAGDGNCLDGVTAALPARALKRLRDVMRVPAHLDTRAAIALVRRRIETRLGVRNEQAAASLVRAAENRGRAVVGTAASHTALRAGVVEMMVIARGLQPEAAYQCGDCGSVNAAGSRPEVCPACGGGDLQTWNTTVELVRLACRQRVPVISTDTEGLSRLGGIGCLLREPVEIEVMPYPAAPQPAALDLVA